MDSDSNIGILRAQIQAQNRSTHAVRALTSFVLYQSAYSLAAGVVAMIAFFPVFTLEDPLWFLVVAAAAIAIGGLFHSFSTAFAELKKSEIVPDRAASGFRIQPTSTARATTASAEQAPQFKPGKCDCGPSTQRESGAWKFGDTYVCKNCDRALTA